MYVSLSILRDIIKNIMSLILGGWRLFRDLKGINSQMRYSFKDKISAILHFLIGTSNPQIFSVLATRGFCQEERDLIFALVKTACGGDKVMRATKHMGMQKIKESLTLLDFWENTWYPLVKVALKYEFPESAEKIFFELRQTKGMELLITVPQLIERVEALESGDESEQQAFAKLEKRGFTKESRAEGMKLVNKCQEAPEILNQDSPEIEQAKKDCWNWYREWSTIARTVITRKDYLISLGFKKFKK